LRVHFFYNRRFAPSNVNRRGTYSRPLRPDYTLIIIPSEITTSDWCEAERIAEEQGRIAYLHFDAKYRIETLVELFGNRDEDPDAEKQMSKTTGRFKRADLYKMHTYNEAIRRTVGSYVLYPGDDPKNTVGENRFERYHEVIPGVGAFAVKPGAAANDEPVGLPFLVGFIRDILSHQLSRFTQSYRVSYWTEATVREPESLYRTRLADFIWTLKPPKDTEILLGFVRNEAGARRCRETATFSCHGVEWKDRAARVPGDATDLQFDPFKADLLAVYTSNRTAPWLAEVKMVKLVSAAERAAETARPVGEMQAAYYYRFELQNFQDISSRDVRTLVEHLPGRTISKPLSDFALCDVVA
jgi:hypothetical protein